MKKDWINGRAAVTLGEAWEPLIDIPPVKAKVEELRAELSDWQDHDLSALALEIVLNDAALAGHVLFRGIGPDGRRVDISSTYFDPSRVKGFTLHRGFDPECNEITFAPLHDAQDGAFAQAGQQAAQEPELYHDWMEVELDCEKLAAWLREVDPDNDEAECLAWLVFERRKYPAEPVGRDAYFDAAKEQWPFLPERAFNRCWERAKRRAPTPTWDRPGPRPKTDRKL